MELMDGFDIPTLLYMKDRPKVWGVFVAFRFLCSDEQQFSQLRAAQGSMRSRAQEQQ
jgi:hypothetical protein